MSTEPNNELSNLVFQAADHALISVAEGGALIPFAMFATGEQVGLQRFVAETLEESIAAARKAIRQLESGEHVVLAYDGYITMDGDRTDAIWIDGQSRNEATAHRFAVRYRPKSRFKKMQPLGNVIYGGGCDPLW